MSWPIESEPRETPMEEKDREVVLRLERVSVRFRVMRERIDTIRAYLIHQLKQRVRYDEFWALQDVDLEVYKGEVLGIIGRNGAGKSTLLKVVSRVLQPTKGRVWIKGQVAPLLELSAGFHPELTGRENILLNGALLGFLRKEMEAKTDQIVDFAELWDFIDAPLRTYSSGMTARLGFAIATDVRPDILIVDEVLAVGDEAFRQKSEARMRGFQARGTTILFVSHTAAAIKTMCQRAVWLDKGMVRMVGEVGNVIEAYQRECHHDGAGTRSYSVKGLS